MSRPVESKSDVVQKSLKLLREKELDESYTLANLELNNDFEFTTNDGLNNETWNWTLNIQEKGEEKGGVR